MQENVWGRIHEEVSDILLLSEAHSPCVFLEMDKQFTDEERVYQQDAGVHNIAYNILHLRYAPAHEHTGNAYAGDEHFGTDRIDQRVRKPFPVQRGSGTDN